MSDTHPQVKRTLVFAGEIATTVVTLAMLVALPILTRAGEWWVGLAVGVALAGGGAATLIELVARRGRRSTEPVGLGGASASVTALIQVGAEPTEVSRTSVILAMQVGPCALVVRDDHELAAPLRALDVPVYRGVTVEDAIGAAAGDVSTDAVLLLSGRAVPVMERVEHAAGALDDTCGWVIGTTAPFNHDWYAPDGRAVVGAALRERSQNAGLDLWEPNATLVRTALLRAHPFAAHRPRGSWLRARQSEGHVGIRTEETFAMTAAPSGASTFWPDVMASQRGAASDASDAIGVRGLRPRVLALLVMVRELYAIPMLAWLVLLFMVASTGRFPFDVPVGGAVAAVVALLVARWLTLRLALGLPLRPTLDARAALYYLPGSLAAVSSALRRRVRPPWRRVSTRPLEWAALLLTVLAVTSIVARDPGAPVSRLAVGTSLVTLVALWLFFIRAWIQRNWERTTFRISCALDAEVNGVAGQVYDGSPDGVGIAGSFDALEVVRGDEVALDVRLDDGRLMSTVATVADQRTDGDEDVVGLVLRLDDTDRSAWAAQLMRSALRESNAAGVRHAPVASDVATNEPVSKPAVIRIVDRMVAALVAVIAVVVMVALGLLVLGYQPLVVRSASMTPAIRVGDVVVTEAVPIADLEVGDVVTRPASVGGESITHRLQSVSVEGDEAVLRTKGDANDSGETWSVPADSTLRRVQWTIPWVGIVVAAVRTNPVTVVLGGAVVGLVAFALIARRHDVASDRRAKSRPGVGVTPRS